MGVSLDYVAKETATNLWRNRMMALAAILTVAVSLSLVGTALLLRQAVNRQIGQFGSNVSLQIFMNADATPQQVASVRSLIEQTPQITHFTYLDHAASYAQAKRILASSPTALEALTPATTPTVFDCQLKSPDEAPTVAAIFKGYPGVYATPFPAQSIRVLQQVTNVLQAILLAIAIVLLVSSSVLILNAIRVAIFARRREIGVMKLVGATNWFIRVPFMLEGLVQGLFGAVVAVGIVLLSNVGVGYLIRHYHVTVLGSSVLPASDLAVTELVVVAIGLVVGVAGSSVAIRRFLDV
ncbi:MAG TPA: permease-like cell division protein FtsX [Acidimicrobiales bacterium]|jgi:cell division transport system permease protein|nr:permease-like cell division protein FtsX [Acidimicrobiales bacterium]